MTATAKGYQYAIDHPQVAAQILISITPKDTFPDTKFITESQKFLSAHYVDKGRQWGLQDQKAWQRYPQFYDSDAVEFRIKMESRLRN